MVTKWEPVEKNDFYQANMRTCIYKVYETIRILIFM